MTYATLQSEIADDLNRQDLTAVIPRFIRDAEAYLSSAIRHRRMETLLDVDFELGDFDESGVSGAITLPTSFLEAKSLRITSGGVDRYLEQVSPESEEFLFRHRPSYPQYYAIMGNALVTRPAYTGVGTLAYYTSIPALSDTNTSNWLLERFPNAYRFAALVEGAKYLRDQPLEESYTVALKDAIAGVMMDERLHKSTRGQIPPTAPAAETRDQMRQA